MGASLPYFQSVEVGLFSTVRRQQGVAHKPCLGYARCAMLLATFLLFLQSLVSGPAPETPSVKHIPRFQMITTGLYRGGQPEREGFEYLKKTGIKTVINFRTDNNDEERM